MSNTKISALTSATTPLAGTEVLPVVQSSTTKQVSVANLTAGRAVSALSYASTSGFNFNSSFTSANNYVGCDNTASGAATLWFRQGRNVGAGSVDAVGLDCLNAAGSTVVPGIIRGNPFYITDSTGTTTFSGGNVTIGAGNLVQGTAAKGVNFTANTPLAGMTSQLLNWYEEGTWTPTAGAGLTVVGTFSSTGTYTRVGRQVTITGSLNGTTSVATAGGGVAICAGIPFAAGSTSIGIAAGVWTAPIGAVIISTTLYSATAIAATGTILFSVAYQV